MPDGLGGNVPLLQKKNEPKLILYSRDSNEHRSFPTPSRIILNFMG